MNKLYLSISLLIAFLNISSAQQSMDFILLPGLDSTIQKTAFIRNPDSTILIGTRQVGLVGWGSTMIKLDMAGTPVSAHYIQENIRIVEACSDNGYVMVTGGIVPTLIKTDLNFNIQWAKKLVIQTSTYYFQKVVEKGGLIYLVVNVPIGYIDPALSFYPTYTAVIYKFDLNGNLLDQQVLADVSPNAGRYNLYPAALTVADNGDLYLALAMITYANAGTCNRVPAIIKLDSSLNVLWSNIYIANIFNGVSGLKILKDGNLAFYGDHSSYYPFCNYFHHYFEKIETAGNVLFAKDHHHNFFTSQGTISLTELDDSSLVFSRQYNDTVLNQYIPYFDHVSSTGNILNSSGFLFPASSGDNNITFAEDLSGIIPLCRFNGRDTLLFMEITPSLITQCNSIPNVMADSNLSVNTSLFNVTPLNYTFSFNDTTYLPFINTSVTSIPACSFTGISELNSKYLHIYPNPGSSKFNIIIPETQEIVSIELYDVTGRKGNILFGLQNIAHKHYELDLSDYPEGMYLIKLRSPNKEWIGKLIKY